MESGIDHGRLLAELTPSETVVLCRTAVTSAVTFFESDETASYACTLGASLLSITLGEDPTLHVDEHACLDAREECLDLPKTTSITGPDCLARANAVPPTCTATVGEYEACLERLFDAWSDEWRSTTCSSLAKVPLEEWPGARIAGPAQVDGCTRIQRDCAGLPWPAVAGAYGQANDRSEAIRDARAAAADSSGL